MCCCVACLLFFVLFSCPCLQALPGCLCLRCLCVCVLGCCATPTMHRMLGSTRASHRYTGGANDTIWIFTQCSVKCFLSVCCFTAAVFVCFGCCVAAVAACSCWLVLLLFACCVVGCRFIVFCRMCDCSCFSSLLVVLAGFVVLAACFLFVYLLCCFCGFLCMLLVVACCCC